MAKGAPWLKPIYVDLIVYSYCFFAIEFLFTSGGGPSVGLVLRSRLQGNGWRELPDSDKTSGTGQDKS